MPRYKFSWGNLPGELLDALVAGEDPPADDPVEALRGWYGARPDEEFVRENWDWLRESWLASDSTARQAVVEALWDLNVGEGTTFPKSKRSELEYLRSCRNARRLREVVLDFFVKLGEVPAPAVVDADTAEPTGRSNGEPTPPGRATTAAELENRLWAAANALRGPVDPADFKTYVFPMLFWKWISDTWEYEHAEALIEWGEDLNDEIEADLHRFEVPDGSRWAQVTNKAVNLGAEITKAFQRIEKANPRSLAGIFGDAVWANKERLPESTLLGMIKAFNQIPLNPVTVSHDLLGHGYEYLLKNFADESGKKAGEFFTPPEVVNLLVEMLRPEPGESVYDPACGSGGMLVATINQLRQQGKDHRGLRLYGQEVNLTTSSIARMNLFLHEIEDFDIKRGDTLRAPAFKDRSGAVSQFDVVIANPPFSLSDWGADRWPADPRAFCGIPPAKNGDFAFVQHMICSMKPGAGRVGVVMPHGVLFRGGAEGKIRQCLLQTDLLEAIVGLPPNLFYSTGIPACLLIFRAEKSPERQKHVLVVDASSKFAKGKNRNTMTASDREATVAAYREGEDSGGESGISVRLVSLWEIEANGFDLNLGRYIKSASEDAADLVTAINLYQEARTARLAAEQHMLELLTVAGLEIGDE